MVRRPLVILGAGRIARALLGQLLSRGEHLRARYGLELPVAAISNSRYLIRGAPYVSPDHLTVIAAGGLDEGEPVTADALSGPRGEIATFVHARNERSIVVDLTASDRTAETLIAALDAGCDVALANKKALCQDYDT